ncbi:hypothetical protein U1Q18_038748 [Sarracenia purpurea var. burkii]
MVLAAMNDTSGKTASSLAITEKRPHKPGGCVGIFFQLFDWNRRFAKKKLFPKKLLPPARPKQDPRKFGGVEKLPKLRLIASENSGGFPNPMKNGISNNDPSQKSGMRPPCLVARLMGLESLPAVQQDKLKKASSNDNGSKPVAVHSGFCQRGPNLGKAGVKHELRPQKLQKTGPSERQALSRFGAEALQFKSVLSRSRKQQQHRPKLASPVKSPRVTSGRNASRLIGAAARILEPGLQASNRAKCALTYSSTLHHIRQDVVTMEETVDPSLDLPQISSHHVTTFGSLNGQPCKNCGSVVDVVSPIPNLEEQPLPFGSSISNYVHPSFQGLERNKPRPAMSFLEQEKEIRQEQPVFLATQGRNNIRTRAEAIAKRKPLTREDQIQWHLTSPQQFKPQKDEPSSISFKHKTQRQNQISASKGRVPPRSDLCSLRTNRVSSAANAISDTKDFVALNRSLSCTRSKMPVSVNNCKCDAERKPCNKRDGSLSSPVRKRRSTIVNQEGESNRTSGNKDCDAISFTFSSPMKQKTENVISHNCNQKISLSDRTDRKMSSEKSLPLSGDALGALLEQKLEELTCQEDDELAAGGGRPKRTTAMILQELIYALTAEMPVSHDAVAVGSNEEKMSCNSDHSLNAKLTFQAKDKIVGDSFGLRGGDHLSPGSVLEAPFSNDSCLSSSVDDNSAPNPYPASADCFYDGLQSLDRYEELLDSATSLSKGSHDLDLVNLIRHISEVLYSIGLADSGLKGSKLVHAEEVILNSELIFGSASKISNQSKDFFSLSQFLIYELETLASSLWSHFGHFLGAIHDPKDGNQLKQFLFDCVMEYLDSRYVLYCKSGFKAWARMSFYMTANKLITGVVEEVRRWTHLAGKIPDEIIEREMSRSLGKWTDFEIEEYEIGAEIDGEMLQMLVDEIVIDLYAGNSGSLVPLRAAV